MRNKEKAIQLVNDLTVLQPNELSNKRRFEFAKVHAMFACITVRFSYDSDSKEHKEWGEIRDIIRDL